MKLVRENLFEAFREDGDPIRDMGIGSFKKEIHFDSDEEAVNFIISILPDILGTDEIPEDIISDSFSFITNKYYGQIERYVERYIKIEERNPGYQYTAYANALLVHKLYQRGFDIGEKGEEKLNNINNVFKKWLNHKMKTKSVHEAFKEEGDPIEDMGIGAFETYQHFDSDEEAVNFIISILPDILNTDEIPENILNQQRKYIREEYYSKIRDYVETYIKIGKNVGRYQYSMLTGVILAYKLYKMGFDMGDDQEEKLDTIKKELNIK